MKAKEIRYRRNRSLGNYEHEGLEIAIELEAGDTAEQVFVKAKAFVMERLFPTDDVELQKARDLIKKHEDAEDIPF